MFNPMMFSTPQQQELLEKMQEFTKRMKYVIHTEGNKVEVSIDTEDAEAAQLIPQLQEGIVTSVTQMLYLMFAMHGERV